MRIQVLCDNPGSWIVPYALDFVESQRKSGHEVVYTNDPKSIENGDVLIMLSCEKIFRKLSLNRHNLVVHGSELPKGRGWSPMTWLILEGKNRLPVTLFEAVDAVDAGDIYGQKFIELDGTELIEELRDKQASATIELLNEFIERYPNVTGTPQVGEPSYYPRRNKEDSELDIHQTISEQFNQFRVADNEKYPTYFVINNQKFILKIYKEK
jgi:methionyl-tRNA formyltransferase